MPALVLTILLGALMVSNFSYYSFKDINLSDRIPYMVMLAVVLGVHTRFYRPAKVGFCAVCPVYAVSGGPVLFAIRVKRKRKRGVHSSVKIEN